jgi:hypothetical protein
MIVGVSTGGVTAAWRGSGKPRVLLWVAVRESNMAGVWVDGGSLLFPACGRGQVAILVLRRAH